MRRSLYRLLWEEDAVTSPEWAFIATILVLGAITGIVMSRAAMERSEIEKPNLPIKTAIR